MSDVNVSFDTAPAAVTVNLGASPVTVTVALGEGVGVPPGGTPDQVLTKTGTGPQDQAWRDNNVATEVGNAMAEHVNAADPHPQYTTAGEAAAAAPVQSVAGRTGAVVLAAADVGLGSVDNTADAAKPVSVATQAALDLKAAAADLADLAGAVVLTGDNGPLRGDDGYLLFGPRPPVGTIAGLPEVLALKADLVAGKVPAAQLPAYATVGEAAAAAPVQSVAGRTGTVVLTKADVGLGSVDNTADAAKPVSAATQTALNGKAATSHTHALGDTTGLSAALDDKAAAADLADLAGAVALAGSAGALRGDGGYLLAGPRPPVGTIDGLPEVLALKADLVAGKVPAAQLPALAGLITAELGSAAWQETNTGPAGPTGATGAAGAAGATGATGPAGADGSPDTAAQIKAKLETLAGADRLAASAVKDLGDAAAKNTGTTAGTVAAGDHTHSAATTSLPGFLSAADKTRLDGLSSPLAPPSFEIFEHFINRTDGGTSYYGATWVGAGSNGGGVSINTVAGLPLHPGIARWNNTSASNSWAHASSGSGQLRFGSATFLFEACVMVPQLSTAGETFTFVTGFYDGGGSVTVVDGAFFRYSHGVNGGKWQAVTSNNSTQSTADTGVTVVANDWVRLRVEVNAAGTLATFTVSNETGTVLASTTIATNIPTASGRETGSGGVLNKSVGTGSVYVQADYFYLKVVFA